MNTLDQWETEYREYVRRIRLTEPKWKGLESRVLTLIDLVRKKDKALRECLHARKPTDGGPSLNWKAERMTIEALALTETLK